MSSAHYTRNFVWVVVTSIGSIGGIPFQKLRDLGISGIYLWASDPQATDDKRREIVSQGFACGLGYPANTEYMRGDDVARLASARLAGFARTEAQVGGAGSTPFLCDFEPSYGSTQFWRDFIYGNAARQTRGWRGRYGVYSLNDGYRGYRVTDMTPEPFKASQLPASDLSRAQFDVVAQTYFGDMSRADPWEVGLDWSRTFPLEAIHTFIDGGRKTPLPIFYEGRIVRKLQLGTHVWNANLLREAGLI